MLTISKLFISLKVQISDDQPIIRMLASANKLINISDGILEGQCFCTESGCCSELSFDLGNAQLIPV